MITERIDAITHMGLDYRASIIPAPKSVKIELTQRCNYRCQFCALTQRNHPPGDLSFRLFQDITKEMQEAGVEEIGVFYIGESFTVLDKLVKAITWLKGVLNFPYVFLTTNGSLANPEAVDKVMGAGLDSLKWSITSADPEEFARIVQVKSALFQQSLENLKQAKRIRDEKGYQTKIYASSIKYSNGQAPKMESLLDEHVRPFVDQHYWLPLYSFGDATGDITQDMGYDVTPGNKGRMGGLVDSLPCWCIFTEGHVAATGHLTACGFDATNRFTMADLNEVSFMDGWNSNRFQTLRRAHLNKDVTGTECSKCVLYTG